MAQVSPLRPGFSGGHDRSVKNVPKKGPLNRRSLHCAAPRVALPGAVFAGQKSFHHSGAGPVIHSPRGHRKVAVLTSSIQVASVPKSNGPPLVIPTEAQRSGGICSLRGVTAPDAVHPIRDLSEKYRLSPLSSRPERSVVEICGQRLFLGNVFRQSLAEWDFLCGCSFFMDFFGQKNPFTASSDSILRT
jgi:hypothetical protein